MTFAESLRDGLVNDFKKDILQKYESRFKNDIAERISSFGKWYIICDTHVREIRLDAIPNKYCDGMVAWLKELGFKPFFDYNSHGVRYIKVEI